MSSASFIDGSKPLRVSMYGPADVEYDARYYDMRIVYIDEVAWIHVHCKKNGELTLVNCAKAACITFAPTGPA